MFSNRTEVATHAESAKLNAVSANILMGQMSCVGTGIFDLLLDEEACSKAIHTFHDDESEELGGEAKDDFANWGVSLNTPAATPIMETLTGFMIAGFIFFSGQLIATGELEVNNFFSFFSTIVLNLSQSLMFSATL